MYRRFSVIGILYMFIGHGCWEDLTKIENRYFFKTWTLFPSPYINTLTNMMENSRIKTGWEYSARWEWSLNFHSCWASDVNTNGVIRYLTRKMGEIEDAACEFRRIGSRLVSRLAALWLRLSGWDCILADESHLHSSWAPTTPQIQKWSANIDILWAQWSLKKIPEFLFVIINTAYSHQENQKI